MNTLLNKDINTSKPLVTFTATDLITDEIIAQGCDIDLVVEQADIIGKEYMINFITNPDYSFIF